MKNSHRKKEKSRQDIKRTESKKKKAQNLRMKKEKRKGKW